MTKFLQTRSMDGVEAVDVLAEFYFKLGFNHKEILHLLAFYNRIVISIRSLKLFFFFFFFFAKMGLFRRKSSSDILYVAMFNNGTSGIIRTVTWIYKLLHSECIKNGFVVNQGKCSIVASNY